MSKKDFEPTRNSKIKQTLDDRKSSHGPEGFGGTHLSEEVPAFHSLSCERVIKGQNNTWIVLGRDRPAGKDSGAVGDGATEAGMIDLCVGRLSGLPKQVGLFDQSGMLSKRDLANNDMFSDAARVYITQKGDIDQYFGLAKGSEELPSADRSAVAVKADHVRIVGRNHIKIVTGRAKVDGAGRFGERLSTGGRNERAGKIDLIAGNYTDSRSVKQKGWFRGFEHSERMKTLQPIPKGENLAEMLTDLISVISDVIGFCKFNSNQINYLNKAIAGHFHPIGAVGPVPVAMPSPILVPICAALGATVKTKSTTKHKSCNYNLGVVQTNYVSSTGGKYINSSHVNVT